jgi:hypothetical protein
LYDHVLGRQLMLQEKDIEEFLSLRARLQQIQKPQEAPHSLNRTSLLPGELSKIIMREYFDCWHSTISGDLVKLLSVV